MAGSSLVKSATFLRSIQRWRQSGFTLLEILLVLVLLGLAASAIVPSLMSDDSGALMKKEARKLLMLLQVVQEQAVTNGQDLGMQKTIDGYQFLAYQQGKWQPMDAYRLLSSVKLNQAIRLTLLPGESVWRESLGIENDTGYRFKEAPENPVDEVQPDLFFRASGEVTPAELQLSPVRKPKQVLSIHIQESGIITLEDKAVGRDVR